jgi:hypothetical protein
MNLTINTTEGNKNYVYPSPSSTYGNNSIAQITFNLYKNGSLIGAGNQWDNMTYGGGLYVYVYNTSGNTNYSSASKNYNLTITPAATSIKLYINGTDWTSDRTYTYPNATLINATINVSAVQSSIVLTRNGTPLSNPENNLLGAGIYNYTGAYAGNQNYSASNYQRILTINKNTSVSITQYLNGSTWTQQANKSYPNATNMNATSSHPDVQSKINQYMNRSLITNPEQILRGFGTYNYSANFSDTDNYTVTQVWEILNISQGSPLDYMNLTINGTESNKAYTYPSASSTYGNSSISQITFNLYKNNSLLGSGNQWDNQTYGGGLYIYKYNTSGNENYTTAQKQYNLTINKANNIIHLYLNNSENNMSCTYPCVSNSTATAIISPSLYKNGSSVSNPDIIQLGAGYYNYTANATGNENYSDNTTGATYFLNVSRGATGINLYLNGTEASRNYEQYNIANFTAKINVSGLTITLQSNYSGFSPINNDTVVYNISNLTTTANFSNLTANFSGNQNYSSSITTYFFNVTPITPKLNMTLVEPAEGSTKLVKEGDSFLINATIKCKDSDCGTINANARYNGVVINGSGILFTNDTVTRSCTLTIDQTCWVNWTISTTTIGTWNIDVNASGVVLNETADATLSVYRLIIQTGGGGGISQPGIGLLLDLEITNLTPYVFAGDNLDYTIKLTNVGEIRSFDAVIHKKIKDLNNNLLLQDTITRSMTDSLEISDFINIPRDFEFGRYLFELEVDYEGKKASAVATFDIKKECIIMKGTSYDLLRKMNAIYTNELRNVTLEFDNICDVPLGNPDLYLDGALLRLSTIPLQGLETAVDFDKYGKHNATFVYTQGRSEILFYLDRKTSLLPFAIMIIATAAVGVIGFYLYKKYKKKKEVKEPEKLTVTPEPFKSEEVRVNIKELKEKIEEKIKEKFKRRLEEEENG